MLANHVYRVIITLTLIKGKFVMLQCIKTFCTVADFVVTVWGLTIHGCEGQMATYYLYIVYIKSLSNGMAIKFTN